MRARKKILFSRVHRVTLVLTKCSYIKNHNGTHAPLIFFDVFPKAMQSLPESFMGSLHAASLDTYRADDSDIMGALNLLCPGELEDTQLTALFISWTALL